VTFEGAGVTVVISVWALPSSACVAVGQQRPRRQLRPGRRPSRWRSSRRVTPEWRSRKAQVSLADGSGGGAWHPDDARV